MSDDLELDLTDEQIQCCSCDAQVAFSESRPYTSTLRNCTDCHSNTKRMSDRCSKNPSLKSWWKSLDKEGKKEWFKKNKAAATGNVGTYKKRKFEMPTYIETEANGCRSIDDDVDGWLPFEEYAIRKSALGMTVKEIEAQWAKDLADPTKQSRRHSSGVMLMHCFKGMETRRGQFQEQRQDASRQALLQDAKQLEELEAPAAKKTRIWLDSLKIDQSASLSAQPSVPDSQVQGLQSYPVNGPSILRQELKDLCHRPISTSTVSLYIRDKLILWC